MIKMFTNAIFMFLLSAAAAATGTEEVERVPLNIDADFEKDAELVLPGWSDEGGGKWEIDTSFLPGWSDEGGGKWEIDTSEHEEYFNIEDLRLTKMKVDKSRQDIYFRMLDRFRPYDDPWDNSTLSGNYRIVGAHYYAEIPDWLVDGYFRGYTLSVKGSHNAVTYDFLDQNGNCISYRHHFAMIREVDMEGSHNQVRIVGAKQTSMRRIDRLTVSGSFNRWVNDESRIDVGIIEISGSNNLVNGVKASVVNLSGSSNTISLYEHWLSNELNLRGRSNTISFFEDCKENDTEEANTTINYAATGEDNTIIIIRAPACTGAPLSLRLNIFISEEPGYFFEPPRFRTYNRFDHTEEPEHGSRDLTEDEIQTVVSWVNYREPKTNKFGNLLGEDGIVEVDAPDALSVGAKSGTPTPTELDNSRGGKRFWLYPVLCLGAGFIIGCHVDFGNQ